MRFAITNTLTSFAILAFGVSSTHAWYGTPTSLTARAVTDTCSSVAVTLPPLTDNGRSVRVVETCLCLSALPAYIQGRITTFRRLGGTRSDYVEYVTDILTSVIEQSAPQCTYPDHATATCNDDQTCTFTCGDGFTRRNNRCVCAAPNTVCNGVCGSAACPSGVPQGRRSDFGSTFGSTLRRRASSICSPEHIVCGAFERRGMRSLPFECVDSQNDLESCGGCITPLDNLSPIGVDCTAIVGAVDVACLSGACLVSRCAEGFTLGAGNSTCVPAQLVEQA